jgi:hypothetical protein
MKILRLDCSGHPVSWLNFEDAVTLVAKSQVLWSLGETQVTLKGGRNRLGVISSIDLPAIIASEGKQRFECESPTLSNRALFRRDQNLCLYCGNTFLDSFLTRDHVTPQCYSGPDIWENVVSACQRCNHHKGGRTPEEASMPLLAIPFVPNPFEFMFLSNRAIISDQMDYLKGRFSNRRVWAA